MATGIHPHSSESCSEPPTRALSQLAVGFGALAGLTYGLIVLGALVRANGAGLACPDWPLCFGEVVPVFDVKVGFEWTHRVVAGVVGLVFAGLAAWALFVPAARRAAAGVIAIAAVVLAAQVFLGALTVWEGVASWTVTAHLLTGNAFAVLLLFIARSLGEAKRPPMPSTCVPGWLLAMLGLAGVLLFGQMVLGGWVSSRFLGLACPDWPRCMDGEWFPTWTGPQGIHLLHRTNAYALGVLLPLCAWLGRGHGRLSMLLAVAAFVVVAQVATGIANIVLRIPVEVTGLHSALAAALVGVVSLAVREALLHRSPA